MLMLKNRQNAGTQIAHSTTASFPSHHITDQLLPQQDIPPLGFPQEVIDVLCDLGNAECLEDLGAWEFLHTHTDEHNIARLEYRTDVIYSVLFPKRDDILPSQTLFARCDTFLSSASHHVTMSYSVHILDEAEQQQILMMYYQYGNSRPILQAISTLLKGVLNEQSAWKSIDDTIRWNDGRLDPQLQRLFTKQESVGRGGRRDSGLLAWLRNKGK